MTLAEPAAPAPPAEDSRSLDFTVLLDGTRLRGEEAANIVSVEVDTAVNRPDICTIAFRPLLGGDGLEQPDIPKHFKPGATLEVKQQETTLFDGEVTALEYEHVAGQTTMVVTAHDRRHRLYRYQLLQSFVKMTAGDVVKKLAVDAGVPVTVSAKLPTNLHEYLPHPECTSGEWLERLLGDVGAVTLWKDSKMWAGPLADHAPPKVELQFSGEVDRYRFRASSDGQHKEVLVRSWDARKKVPITGVASAADGRGARLPAGAAVPAINQAVDSGAAPWADSVRVRSAAMTPGDANALAQAISAAKLDATAQLEARTIGNRLLRAGGLVTVKQVPAAFAGTYRLSSVRHVYADGQYWTEFSCHGARDGILSSAIGAPGGGGSPMTPVPGISSVAVGIVTNNKDPDDLGRVKVKFPWMPSAAPIESHWMRIVAMGAGAGRGWFWLPEVNDEVLVAFEHGDTRRPFVLGGLWNGNDRPPVKNSEAVAADGKVNRRFMKTRSGHVLEFDDSPDKPKAELVTKSGKLKMTFDDKKFDFKLASGNDVTIDNQGNLTITTKGNVEITATGSLKLSGNQVSIEARSTLEIKAANSAKVTSNGTLALTATGPAKLSGSAGTEVSSPAVTQVKGSLVQIN